MVDLGAQRKRRGQIKQTDAMALQIAESLTTKNKHSGDDCLLL